MMMTTGLIGGTGLRVVIGALPRVAILPDVQGMIMKMIAGGMIDLTGIVNVIGIVDTIATIPETIAGIVTEIAAIDTAITSTAIRGTRLIHLGMTVIAILAAAAAAGMTRDEDVPVESLASAYI